MAVAYAYSRFSSARQADGDSLRRQLAAATDYAEEMGLELDSSFQDRGVSAFIGKNRLRGALSLFLGQIEHGAIAKGSYLLIDSFDRLTREAVPIAVNLFTKILLEGLIIVTLSDRRRYDRNADVMSVMYAVMQASRSHEESAEKGRKVRAAHEAAKRRARDEGHIWHRLGPTWLKFYRGRWKVIPERRLLIERIFHDLDDGAAPTALAKALNDEGAQPPKNAHAWSSGAVIRLGRNRALLGEYQPFSCDRGRRRRKDGAAIPSYYPAVIASDLFERVQARLTLRKTRFDAPGGPTKRRFNNIFRGRCCCESCGGAFTVQYGGPQKATALYCSQSRQVRGCENTLRYPYDAVEAEVLKYLARCEQDLGPVAVRGDEEVTRRAIRAHLATRQSRLELLVEHGAPMASRGLERVRAELLELQTGVLPPGRRTQHSLEDDNFRVRLSLLSEALAERSCGTEEEVFEARARTHATLMPLLHQIGFSADGRTTVVTSHPAFRLEIERTSLAFGRPEALAPINQLAADLCETR